MAQPSGKLGRQLKWAADRRARFALIRGQQEREAGLVTVRDMDSGEQQQIAPGELTTYVAARTDDDTP